MKVHLQGPRTRGVLCFLTGRQRTPIEGVELVQFWLIPLDQRCKWCEKLKVDFYPSAYTQNQFTEKVSYG